MFPVQVFQDLGAAEALEAALHIIVEPFQRLGSQEPEGNTESQERISELQDKVAEWWMAKVAA